MTKRKTTGNVNNLKAIAKQARILIEEKKAKAIEDKDRSRNKKVTFGKKNSETLEI